MDADDAVNVVVNSTPRSFADVVSTDIILKQGHLSKQGGARGGRKNWKRRWIVLKKEYICYYKEKEESDTMSPSADGLCLGVIPLRAARIVSVENEVDGNLQKLLNAAKSAPSLSGSIDPLLNDSNNGCSHCHKDMDGEAKISCKNCQKMFCAECAQEKGMTGDRAIRVCTSCRNLFNTSTPSFNVQFTLENKALIDIVQRETKSSVFFNKKPPRPQFAVKIKERELWLEAENELEKLQWLKAIADVISSHRLVQMKMSNDGSTTDKYNQELDENSIEKGSSMPAHNQWEIEYSAITILEKIGDGAFGEVFKGRLWGTDVAVKTIKADQVTENVVDDLKKEVAILSQLRHPNVVLYIGACTRPPNVCIVTEWCDKGSLHDVLHDSNVPLDIERIIGLSVGIAQGMNYLHSLERRIIHRDLKSHNVLVDKNFTVKVADFGLSHVRESITATMSNGQPIIPSVKGLTPTLSEHVSYSSPEAAATDGSTITLGVTNNRSLKISSESMGGHYGVFGTPEWMAPEIMEGAAYNQKVDVYSFGIMMSELLTRKLPFRDQYKIKSYMDVVDAVLEDGAMPTLPDWAGTRLKRLIESCLSRNASQRPSFMSIILKLRSMFALSPIELFASYDLPRLQNMLTTADRHNQALAAREIASFKFDHESRRRGRSTTALICARCKHSPDQHQLLEDTIVTSFLAKLTDMLSSSSGKVVLPAVEAIERLIKGGQTKSHELRQMNLEVIRQHSGIQRLLSLVTSRAQQLCDASTRVLLLLIDDMPVDDPAYSALKGDALMGLHLLMEKEVHNLRDRSRDMKKMLDHKNKTAEALKKAFNECSQLPAGISPETMLADVQNEMEEPPRPKTATAVTMPGKEILPSSTLRQTTGDFSVSYARQPVVSIRNKSMQDDPVLRTTTTVDPKSMVPTSLSSNINENTEFPMRFDAEALLLEWPEGFTTQRHHCDWILVRDIPAETWQPKVVLHVAGHIYIFSTTDQVLDRKLPDSKIDTFIGGKPAKFKTGRKFKQACCFHICVQGNKWWFALRDQAALDQWSQIMNETPNTVVDLTSPDHVPNGSEPNVNDEISQITSPERNKLVHPRIGIHYEPENNGIVEDSPEEPVQEESPYINSQSLIQNQTEAQNQASKAEIIVVPDHQGAEKVSDVEARPSEMIKQIVENRPEEELVAAQHLEEQGQSAEDLGADVERRLEDMAKQVRDFEKIQQLESEQLLAEKQRIDDAIQASEFRRLEEAKRIAEEQALETAALMEKRKIIEVELSRITQSAVFPSISAIPMLNDVSLQQQPAFFKETVSVPTTITAANNGVKANGSVHIADAVTVETDQLPAPSDKPGVFMQAANELKLNNPDLNLGMMTKLPKLPTPFVNQFTRRDVWHFSYMTMNNNARSMWVRRFVLYVGAGGNQHIRRLVVYKSHESNPEDVENEIFLSDGSGKSVASIDDNVEAALGYKFAEIDENIVFCVQSRGKPSYVFLCASAVDRNKWMGLIKRVALLAQTTSET